jgi:hypothetical protein
MRFTEPVRPTTEVIRIVDRTLVNAANLFPFGWRAGEVKAWPQADREQGLAEH